MKNIMNHIKKHILLDTILFIIIFIIMYFLLTLCNLQFREWVYIFAIAISAIGIIIGIIQLILKLKKKSVKVTLIVLFILLLILISPVCLFGFAFWYTPEYVVYKYGEKRVAKVNGFLQTYVYYYDYKNPFIAGKYKRIEEYYGKGGFDPIKNKFGNNYKVESITYYDKKGNQVENQQGTKFVDLSKLEEYKKDNSKYIDIEKLLKYIQANYSEFYSDINSSKYILGIGFSNDKEKVVSDERRKRINDIIDNFLNNEKDQNNTYNILISNTGRVSIINTKNYNYDELNDSVAYLRTDGNFDSGKEYIDNFFNSSDLESKSLKIKYNYDVFIKINYIAFISYEDIKENVEADKNKGYYEITINGESQGKYYYPDYELKQVKKDNKVTLIMKSSGEAEDVPICEWNVY